MVDKSRQYGSQFRLSTLIHSVTSLWALDFDKVLFWERNLGGRAICDGLKKSVEDYGTRDAEKISAVTVRVPDMSGEHRIKGVI